MWSSVEARVWPKDKHREQATSCFGTGRVDCTQNMAVTSSVWAVPWFRQVICPSLGAGCSSMKSLSFVMGKAYLLGCSQTTGKHLTGGDTQLLAHKLPSSKVLVLRGSCTRACSTMKSGISISQSGPKGWVRQRCKRKRKHMPSGQYCRWQPRVPFGLICCPCLQPRGASSAGLGTFQSQTCSKVVSLPP